MLLTRRTSTCPLSKDKGRRNSIFHQIQRRLIELAAYQPAFNTPISDIGIISSAPPSLRQVYRSGSIALT